MGDGSKTSHDAVDEIMALATHLDRYDRRWLIARLAEAEERADRLEGCSPRAPAAAKGEVDRG